MQKPIKIALKSKNLPNLCGLFLYFNPKDNDCKMWMYPLKFINFLHHNLLDTKLCSSIFFLFFSSKVYQKDHTYVKKI